jgi:lipopolysaccharide export system ATP-binding protein
VNLVARDLYKRYGKKVVVQKVSLEVSPGEIVGLLGPNGAGKTTTFYMIVGIEKPDGGEVYLGEERITFYPLYRRARKGIRYLPQEPCVFQGLTVEENIVAVLEVGGVSRKERREMAEKILKEFGIFHLRNQKAYQLSGGERRRLEVARAMVLSPRFFLLDEPFQGVDPIAVGELKSLLKEIRNQGIGILISDHQVRETLTLCDRAYILHLGKVIRSGTPEEIMADSSVREVYLGEGFTL